jgi:two-component system, cell cycle sensor histidine kinase and response regulator CckA
MTDKAVVYEKDIRSGLVSGSEVILLIDDEEMVVDVCTQLLQEVGYHVLVARSGAEGIETFAAHQDEIDLVIVDMIMPGMTGGETFDRLRKMKPEVKMLLSSGYSLDSQAEKILARGCNGFIQKPFSIAELSQKIRVTLDNADPRAAKMSA